MKNRLLLEKISTLILPDINNIIKFHAGSFDVFISASLLQRRKEKKTPLLDGALGFDTVSGLELWQRVKY